MVKCENAIHAVSTIYGICCPRSILRSICGISLARLDLSGANSTQIPSVEKGTGYPPSCKGRKQHSYAPATLSFLYCSKPLRAASLTVILPSLQRWLIQTLLVGGEYVRNLLAALEDRFPILEEREGNVLADAVVDQVCEQSSVHAVYFGGSLNIP